MYQFPGFDNAMQLCKMSPLRDTGYTGPLGTIFATHYKGRVISK